MFGPTKYAYIVSKVRGMKGRLLKDTDYSFLLENDLKDIYRFLEETPYGKELSELPLDHFTSANFTRMLMIHFFDIYRTIITSCPDEARPAMSGFLKKLEVELINTILRSKEGEISIEEVALFTIPVGQCDEVLCTNLLERAKNVEEVVRQLSPTEYGPILLERLREYRLKALTLPLEFSLNNYLLDEAQSLGAKLKGVDGYLWKEFWGIYADILSIKSILRWKNLGVDKETIEQYLLPYRSRLSIEMLHKATEASDVESAIRILMTIGDYKKLLLKGLESYMSTGSLLALENSLDKEFVRVVDKISAKHIFTLGTILAFLSSKWREIRNLKLIVKGKEENLSQAIIARYLI